VSLPVPGAKRVGYLELFFDLVFVFAVTQLVGLLHDEHDAAGWGRAALMLWLVWWAWSQFAWTGNAVDLDGRARRVAILLATGAMLVAAASIPVAFETDALWFAAAYVLVRLVGLSLYWVGLRADRAHQAALRTYLPVALVSPALVLAGGFVHGDARVLLWVLAMVVDVASVLAAGRGEFRVDPGHFAERHALIVIVALGETVVAIGATADEVGLDRSVIALVAVSFVAVAALWWCYFDWVQAAAERRLEHEPDHRRRGHLARDLYTFGHLPIVAGTVVFAAAIEEALLHPTDPLDAFATTALAVGPALYLAGFVAGNLRATGRLLGTRAAGLVAVVVAAVALGPRVDAIVTVGLVAAVVVGVAAVESVQRPAPAPEPVAA
jgi:low temperature requirement protein LtrA